MVRGGFFSSYLIGFDLFHNFWQLTTVIQFVLSIYVAHANTSDSFGYQSAVFAAIWSMLLTLCFTGVGSFVIFGDQKLTELQVGLFLGASTMLSELFFALMVIFYILGTNADPNSQRKRYQLSSV